MNLPIQKKISHAKSLKLENGIPSEDTINRLFSSIIYYISSLENNAEQYQQNICSHWGVGNKLHWTLDVGFSEDASRKRNKNAAQNYSILLKIALNLLKNEKTEK